MPWRKGTLLVSLAWVTMQASPRSFGEKSAISSPFESLSWMCFVANM